MGAASARRRWVVLAAATGTFLLAMHSSAAVTATRAAAGSQARLPQLWALEVGTTPNSLGVPQLRNDRAHGINAIVADGARLTNAQLARARTNAQVCQAPAPPARPARPETRSPHTGSDGQARVRGRASTGEGLHGDHQEVGVRTRRRPRGCRRRRGTAGRAPAGRLGVGAAPRTAGGSGRLTPPRARPADRDAVRRAGVDTRNRARDRVGLARPRGDAERPGRKPCPGVVPRAPVRSTDGSTAAGPRRDAAERARLPGWSRRAA